MQNNTPFSRDPTPNLTRTILSVVKEGQAYSGVERRAKSGQQQRATKGSSNTEYNHGLGEYRPAGEEDRYYAKQRAEAAAAKAKKTTTVKEGLLGKLKKKAQRFGQAASAFNSDGDPYEMKSMRRLQRKREGQKEKGGRLRNSKGVLESKSGLVEEQKYIEEYIAMLESALESIAKELECSVEDLLEETKKTAQLSSDQRAAAMKDRNSRIHRTPAELKAHDAGMKAYVKSQNNRTDSKGKKLDPYDDYQS